MEYAGGEELLQFIKVKGEMSKICLRKVIFQFVNEIHYCHPRHYS